MADKDDKPKIIVDDDWKTRAQAEKAKLAEEAAKAPPEGEAAGGPREIPPASFASLVGSLMTQVFMALGGYEDPQTHRRYVDLELAKHYIDTFNILEEKTRGNLSEEEKKLLDRSLYEARMQYVQIAQAAVKI
jgi:hypothetical protein